MSALVIAEVDNEGFKVLNTSGTEIDPATDATLATLATETKLEAVRVLLASLDAKDFATQTTLATRASETTLSQVNGYLASLDGKDFATETTLGTLATETKLEAVRVLLASLDGKDFATETTLSAIKDTDGIKKIVDALPTGDNWIGRVKVGDGVNVVAVTNDGGTYKLESITKLRNIAGAIIDPATAGKQDTANGYLASLDGYDFATETTLDAVRDNIGEAVTTPAANTLLSRLQTVIDRLTSIKDTDGVQIIDDIVRIGDVARNGINSILNNAIRRLEARSSITAPDGSLDVAVVTDNSINRLEARSTIVGQVDGSGSEQKVTTIQDIDLATQWRLQTEARLAPGSHVNIGTGIPANPSDLLISFVMNGAAYSLLVDGSTTPVTFTFGADPTSELAIQDLLIVFAADDFDFDGVSFGPNVALTNGVDIKTTINTVTTTLFTIKQNEDFLRIPGRPPIVNNTGPKDLLAASFGFGGLLKLEPGTTDKIEIVINDDLTSTKLKYFTATVFAAKG